LRHAQAAVLGGYLHAEAAQVGQALHVLIGDLRVAFDDAAVDGVEELPQLAEEGAGARLVSLGWFGERVDQLQRKTTEEQFFGE